MKTPIFFLCFNRPIETARVLSRIHQARPKYLYIVIDFEDSPEHYRVLEVVYKAREEFIKIGTIVTIIKNTENLGCRLSSVKGIDRVFQSHDRIIMIEDDTLPDLSFFTYAENMLDYYEHDKRIWQVSGNNMHDIPFEHYYGFSKFCNCWGWGTWRDRWIKFKYHEHTLSDKVLPFYLSYDMKRRLRIETTWDYNWFLTILLQHGLCVTPRHNLVDNISTSGLHIKRKWGDLSVKPIHTLKKLELLYPHKYESFYYFISQIKGKLKNIFA
jgi:hypothetical protein